MAFEIKEYEEQYYKEVVDIFDKTFGIAEKETKNYISFTLAKEEAKFWVVVEENKVLGLLQYSYEAWNKVGNIGMIGTTPDAKGKGIGRALMNQAEKYSKEVSVRKIYVDTAADNPGAQIFYIKMGYFPEYTMKDYYEPGLHGVNFSKYIK